MNGSTRDHYESDTYYHTMKIEERRNAGRGGMGWVMEAKGVRGHVSEFPRSEKSQTAHETVA